MAIVKKVGMNKFWAAKSEGKKLANGETLNICRIVGQASGVKHGESNFGPWTALTGLFEFTDLRTGETIATTQAFVPDILLGYVQPTEGDNVKFAVDMYAIGSDTSPVGFEYGFKTLIEAQDPLLEMKKQLAALPAPTAVKAEDKKTAKKAA